MKIRWSTIGVSSIHLFLSSGICAVTYLIISPYIDVSDMPKYINSGKVTLWSAVLICMVSGATYLLSILIHEAGHYLKVRQFTKDEVFIKTIGFAGFIGGSYFQLLESCKDEPIYAEQITLIALAGYAIQLPFLICVMLLAMALNYNAGIAILCLALVTLANCLDSPDAKNAKTPSGYTYKEPRFTDKTKLIPNAFMALFFAVLPFAKTILLIIFAIIILTLIIGSRIKHRHREL